MRRSPPEGCGDPIFGALPVRRQGGSCLEMVAASEVKGEGEKNRWWFIGPLLIVAIVLRRSTTKWTADRRIRLLCESLEVGASVDLEASLSDAGISGMRGDVLPVLSGSFEGAWLSNMTYVTGGRFLGRLPGSRAGKRVVRDGWMGDGLEVLCEFATEVGAAKGTHRFTLGRPAAGR